MNRFLRYSVLAAVAMTMAQPVWARQLSADEALQRATSQQAPGMLKAKGTDMASFNLVYQATASAVKTAEPMVYVFAGNGGFVVTPADDQFPAILGYGDRSAVSGDAIAPELKWWLGEYAREMEYYLSNAGQSDRLKATATDNKSVISPLVKTKWNQDTPYNNLCPSLDLTNNGQTSSEPTVTGCVATAMAQIMKYHNWPDVGVGSHSYDWQRYSNSAKKTLSYDFAATHFDWSNMIDVYNSGSYTTAQANAVAQLMYACGVSVDMNYNAARNGGSGATNVDAANALKTYFKYSQSVHIVERDILSYAEWENAIYAELKAKRPVLLTGSSAEGGHAFVCDGYAGDRYYHINWGWGGISDGNFLLCRLNPDDQGIGSSAGGYNSNQAAICGIQPVGSGSDTGELQPAAIEFWYNLSYSLDNNQYYYTATLNNNGTTRTGYFFNSGGEEYKGYFGTIFTDVETGATVLETKTYGELSLKPGYGYTRYRIVSGQVPADGTYYAFPAYWKGSDATAQNMLHTNGMVDRLVVKFENGAITSVSAPNMAEFLPDLTAIYLTVPDKITVGTAVTFSTSVVNNSDVTDYYGDISFCYAAKGSTTPLESNPVSFNVPAGLTIPYSFAHTFTGVAAGQYEAWFVDGKGQVISNRYPFTISAGSSALTGSYRLKSITPVNFTPNVSTKVDAVISNTNSDDTNYSQFIYTYTDRSDASNVVTVNSPTSGAWNPFQANVNYSGLNFNVTFTRTGIYDLVVSRRKYTYSGGYVYATNNYETISTPIKVTVGNTASTVTLNQTAVKLKVNETQSLTATVLPADALDKSVTWTSSYPDVVSVDSNGKLTGLKSGTANVYAATSNGKYSVCAVTVANRTEVEDITADADDTVTGVYNLSGVRIADTLDNLPRGLYIVTSTSGNTRKVTL